VFTHPLSTTSVIVLTKRLILLVMFACAETTFQLK
jgi:hypothetical protein